MVQWVFLISSLGSVSSWSSGSSPGPLRILILSCGTSQCEAFLMLPHEAFCSLDVRSNGGSSISCQIKSHDNHPVIRKHDLLSSFYIFGTRWNYCDWCPHQDAKHQISYHACVHIISVYNNYSENYISDSTYGGICKHIFHAWLSNS